MAPVDKNLPVRNQQVRPDVAAPAAKQAPVEAPVTQAPAQVQTTKPGWKGEVAGVTAKVKDEIADQAMAATRSDNSVLKLGTDVLGFASVSGELKLKALTKDNDIDPTRVASGKVWNQATVEGKISGGTEFIHAGKTVTARAILPTDIATSEATFGGVLKSFGQNAQKLASSLPKGFDADAPFKSKNLVTLPPGSEVSVKFVEDLKVGAGKGASVSAGQFSAGASAGISDTISREFARSAYIMPDGRIYAEVGETANNTFGANAEVHAGADMSGAIGNAIEKPINKTIGVKGDLGGNISDAKPLTIGGVFDPKDPKQMAAMEQLFAANPYALKANREQVMQKLASVGVGFDYAAEKRAAELHANLKFGDTNLLHFSSVSKSEDGKLRVASNDGSGLKETDLSQAQFDKEYSGKFPSFFIGKNGSVHVGATEITNLDGTKTTGASMSTTIQVDKLDEGMLSRTRNLLTSLGVDTAAAKVDGAVGGKAELKVEFAMTKPFFDNIQALGGNKEAALQALFDKNFAIVNGGPAPWNDATPYPSMYNHGALKTNLAKEFNEALTASKQPQGDGGGSGNFRHDYNRGTVTPANPKGRDFDADKAAFESRNLGSRELAAADGPASQWGGAIDAIGKSKDRPFLIWSLSAHELGAPLVNLSAIANGVEFKATPNLAARPQTLENEVGLLTSRWNQK